MPVIIIVLHNYLWASFPSSQISGSFFTGMILCNRESDYLNPNGRLLYLNLVTLF